MTAAATADLAAELAEMREVAALCRLQVERKAGGFRLVRTGCMPEIASTVLPDMASLRMALRTCLVVRGALAEPLFFMDRDELAALLFLCTAPAAGGMH